MDDLDRRIIDRLLEDGRASYAAIGAEVGLSAPAVKRRADRLVADGVIRGFTAVLDPAAMGWTTEAYVEVHCQGAVSPDELKRAFARVPEVHSAATTQVRLTRSCASWLVTSATSSRRWSRYASRWSTSRTPTPPSCCPG